MGRDGKWTTRLRSCASIRNTYKSWNRIVGTTKESTEAYPIESMDCPVRRTFTKRYRASIEGRAALFADNTGSCGVHLRVGMSSQCGHINTAIAVDEEAGRDRNERCPTAIIDRNGNMDVLGHAFESLDLDLVGMRFLA